MEPIRFHLAFPVADIALTKTYYGEGLGCQIGRETPVSVILNLYGHQLVAHLTQEELRPQRGIYPRHFGLIFPTQAEWQSLADRAQVRGLPFYQEPRWRFVGTPWSTARSFCRIPSTTCWSLSTTATLPPFLGSGNGPWSGILQANSFRTPLPAARSKGEKCLGYSTPSFWPCARPHLADGLQRRPAARCPGSASLGALGVRSRRPVSPGQVLQQPRGQ